MTIGTMKKIRALAPGVLFTLYLAVFSYLVLGVDVPMPDLSKAPYLLIVIIPSAVYYALPLREQANKASHAQITENLRVKLIGVAGYADSKKYRWDQLSGLFYKIVDSDKTLTTKSQLAYFNGAVWTAAVDSAVLSTIFALASVVGYFFGLQNAFIAVLLFLSIAIFSSFLHRAAERKQISIGDEQIEIIRQDHKDTVEKLLSKLDG